MAEADWPRGDIDRYLLARLEKEQLKHALPADKRTLIRRATFDLTGLPPTPAEVRGFLADASPDAFAKVVDRLLASPQYGERWGRHWLDVARYTDSGDARDLKLNDPSGITEAWRYRDWVVSALNRDLPYDRFVIDQIAGDLVEPAAPDRLNVDGTIATGFLAVGPWGNGDADKEKMLTDIVDDQLNVTSRAFLGLTVTCARCHDHKFDPIPTADYYSLAGIFYSTHIIPDVGPKTGGALMLRVPLLPASELAAREAGKGRLAELKKQVAAPRSTKTTGSKPKNLIGQTARYLMAAWDYQSSDPGAAGQPIEQFVAPRGLDSRLLAQWIAYLGLGDPKLLSTSVANAHGIAGLRAWYVAEGVGDPVFQINPTDTPAHSLVVGRFRPTRRRCIPRRLAAWRWRGAVRSPAWCGSAAALPTAILTAATESVGRWPGGWGMPRKSLPPACWTTAASSKWPACPTSGRLDNVDVRPGDALWLVISPRAASYGFDTTIVELEISEMITDGRSLEPGPGCEPRSARLRSWQSPPRCDGQSRGLGICRHRGNFGRREPRPAQLAAGPLVRSARWTWAARRQTQTRRDGGHRDRAIAVVGGDGAGRSNRRASGSPN